jgi:hypothetical protein
MDHPVQVGGSLASRLLQVNPRRKAPPDSQNILTKSEQFFVILFPNRLEQKEMRKVTFAAGRRTPGLSCKGIINPEPWLKGPKDGMICQNRF